MSDLIIKQIQVGPMDNFSYLVADSKTGQGVIIDPGFEPDKLISAAKKEGVNLVALLATHAHFDHVNAIDAVARQLNLPVFIHESEADELPDGLSIKKIKDNDNISLGSYEIKSLHTPGHTPGGICYLIDGNLFTGDTIFVDGSFGRVDLPGGDEDQLKKSLVRLSRLPDETIIWPGHDYGSKKQSTIGREKKYNPYMKG